MNKFYISIPLLACLVFGGFYYQFDRAFKADVELKKATAQAELKNKQRHEVEARQAAYQAAIEAQALRKQEREEKERIAEEKKRARFDLEEQRQHVFDERGKLREQAERMKKEMAGVQDELAKVEASKKSYQDEIVFLQDYVKTAKTNVNAYYGLLDKIAKAEEAAAQAAAQAAAAAKK